MLMEHKNVSVGTVYTYFYYFSSLKLEDKIIFLALICEQNCARWVCLFCFVYSSSYVEIYHLENVHIYLYKSYIIYIN